MSPTKFKVISLNTFMSDLVPDSDVVLAKKLTDILVAHQDSFGRWLPGQEMIAKAAYKQVTDAHFRIIHRYEAWVNAGKPELHI